SLTRGHGAQGSDGQNGIGEESRGDLLSSRTFDSIFGREQIEVLLKEQGERLVQAQLDEIRRHRRRAQHVFALSPPRHVGGPTGSRNEAGADSNKCHQISANEHGHIARKHAARRFVETMRPTAKGSRHTASLRTGTEVSAESETPRFIASVALY